MTKVYRCLCRFNFRSNNKSYFIFVKVKKKKFLTEVVNNNIKRKTIFYFNIYICKCIFVYEIIEMNKMKNIINILDLTQLYIVEIYIYIYSANFNYIYSPIVDENIYFLYYCN